MVLPFTDKLPDATVKLGVGVAPSKQEARLTRSRIKSPGNGPNPADRFIPGLLLDGKVQEVVLLFKWQ